MRLNYIPISQSYLHHPSSSTLSASRNYPPISMTCRVPIAVAMEKVASFKTDFEAVFAFTTINSYFESFITWLRLLIK